MIANVVFSTEAVVIVSGLLGVLAGAVGVLFRLYQRIVDERTTILEERLKSYEAIGIEAVRALEIKVRQNLLQDGKTPVEPIAAIVPEHSSPATVEQQGTADLQTLRARLTAAKLAAGLPVDPQLGIGQLPAATGKVAAALDGLKTEVEGIPDKVVEKIEDKLDER